MTVRKRRKKNRLRGHRTHGQGDTKNRRGAGSRGGRGRAGSHKHKFTKYQGKFGKEKKKVIGKEKGRALNLDQITQFLPIWVAEGKVEKKGSEIVVDGKKLGFGKIVAMGSLDTKVIFENVSASTGAVEKLKENGSVVKATEAQDAGEKGKEKGAGKAKEKEGGESNGSS